MEDLLAHAVDNMRIKNVSKTQLARRAEQPKPSLPVGASCSTLPYRKLPNPHIADDGCWATLNPDECAAPATLRSPVHAVLAGAQAAWIKSPRFIISSSQSLIILQLFISLICNCK